MSKPKFLPLIGGFFFIIILLILIASKLGSHSAATEESASPVASGVAYLQSLEAQDPTEIENTLKYYHQREMAAKREERLKQLESGEISVWSLFEDYVLLGDSRAVGFELYEYLDDNRVMAEAGATILKLQEHIPDIAALNPSYLYLCYGLNDVSIGIWPTPEDYVEDYKAIIEEIRAECPDVKIFISSILLAKDPAFAKSSAWYNIPDYNMAVEAMCEEIGCYFVDSTDLCNQYENLYEVDGIHLQYTFYPYWATNLIMGVYDSEVEDPEETTVP